MFADIATPKRTISSRINDDAPARNHLNAISATRRSFGFHVFEITYDVTQVRDPTNAEFAGEGSRKETAWLITRARITEEVLINLLHKSQTCTVAISHFLCKKANDKKTDIEDFRINFWIDR